MKKIIILAMLVMAAMLSGVALNTTDFNVTYPNLLFIDNLNYTGVSTSYYDVCDAQGDPIGFKISTSSIRMDTGYKLEWVNADVFIYNDASNSLTIDGDAYVKLAATTEIDLTSGGIIDINAATDITLNGISITTTGTYSHVGAATFNNNLAVLYNFDVDGITDLDAVDIDGNVQIDGTVDVGTNGSGFDVTLNSDSVGDNLLWDTSLAKLIITGINATDGLYIADGDLTVVDDISGATITATTGFTGDLTGAVDLDGNDLLISPGALAKIAAPDDNTIILYTNNTANLTLTTTTLTSPDDTISLGAAGAEFKDAYIDGVAYIDRLIASGDVAGSIDNNTLGLTTPLAAKVTAFETTEDVIFNDAQADYDFRVETANYDHTLFIEGSSDNVGVGEDSPATKLHITDYDDTAANSILRLDNVSGSPAANDELRVNFYNSDDGGNQHEYARITCITEDPTDGGEVGQIALSASKAGTLTDVLTVNNNSVLIEGGLTVDKINGAASVDLTDSYRITLEPAIDSYTTFLSVYITVDTANTGACTLDINGLGVKNIKTQSGADPATNDILTTGVAHFVYNGTDFVLMNPATTCD